jgi:hypothetical protein
MARPVRVAAGRELDLRVRDDLPDRGGDLPVRRRPSGGHVVGTVAQLPQTALGLTVRDNEHQYY